MENYFNYFTEIEEHFQRRRGGTLLLSTLDWALIETWKDAGLPLEAVLRGIDAAFDRYEQRPSKSKKVNSLAYCAQAVLAAAESMKEATVGATREGEVLETKAIARGFDLNEIVAFLRKNVEQIELAKVPMSGSMGPANLAQETATSLRALADEIDTRKPMRLEDLERRLTVLEDKLFAALLAGTPDAELVDVRAQADRELAPYRSKMPGAQIEQLLRQYVHKRLLEKYSLPRLSLFYM